MHLTMNKNYMIFLFEQDMIQVKHEMNQKCKDYNWYW